MYDYKYEYGYAYHVRFLGGKTQPENMINDVQQTEGCLK